MASKTRAFVYPVKGRESDVRQIQKLIVEAGCEVVCESAKPGDDFAKCLSEADVLVVLICPETMSDAAVEEFVLAAAKAGKRVVGVWAPGMKGGTLPRVIDKYGDAVIPCDPEAVKEAVCGGVTIWSTPVGTPRPKPKTPRHPG